MKAMKALKSITRIIALAPVLALMFSLMTGFAVRASETELIIGSGTELHKAIIEGDTSTALRLINEGQYNIHEKTDLDQGIALLQGNTPLHLAALVAVPEIAKALIEKGADVNVKNKEGWTPLTLALNGPENGRITINGRPIRFYAETALVLIDAGANVNVRVENGEHASLTPLHLAADPARFAYDVETGGLPFDGSPTKDHFDHLYSEITLALITKGADVNARDNDGNTPIIYAASRGYAEIAQALIANGADVEERLKTGPYAGATLLTMAAMYNYLEAAKVLIANGADVNVGGGDPLRAAADFAHPEIAKVLIANGADVNARGYDDTTPLDSLKFNLKRGVANAHEVRTANVIRAAGGKCTYPLDRRVFVEC